MHETTSYTTLLQSFNVCRWHQLTIPKNFLHVINRKEYECPPGVGIHVLVSDKGTKKLDDESKNQILAWKETHLKEV